MIRTITRNYSAEVATFLSITLLVARLRAMRAATRRFVGLQPRNEWVPWAS
ncbi:MAG TPA: hypothetical protein VIO57_02245 [Chloroflexota bacterium]